MCHKRIQKENTEQLRILPAWKFIEMTFGSFCTVNYSLNTWHIWYHITFVLTNPAYLTTLSKESLLWNCPSLFASLTLKLELPGLQSGRPTLHWDKLILLITSVCSCISGYRLAVSLLQYWLYRHPQQIVAAFIIPIKADPDLAKYHDPIRGCQYPTNNC